MTVIDLTIDTPDKLVGTKIDVSINLCIKQIINETTMFKVLPVSPTQGDEKEIDVSINFW